VLGSAIDFSKKTGETRI